MIKRISVRAVGWLAAILGLAAGSFFAGSGLPGTANASERAPDRSAARFETKFLTGMIDHHGMAIQMANICLQKATHEELRGMCQDVIDAQSMEIQQMQGWLQDWYGKSHEPTMTRADQRQLAELSSLDGAAFERRFMKMLIEHHQVAIARSEKCLQKAYHPELLGLCESMIQAQTAEIAQLRAWLCDWYDVCEQGHGPNHSSNRRGHDNGRH